jgi:uncharacterized damage-inducible protein DinB
MLWIDRMFTFDFPVDLFPNIVERLRGTPARLEDKLALVPEKSLTRRQENTWTIAENVGHLGMVELLWAARLDDFLAGRAGLAAADMEKSTRMNKEARFNDQPIEKLLADFRQKREHLVSRVEHLDREMFARTAHHPRLDMPIRLVDSLFFGAEHDDHHLARITDLIHTFA